VAAVPNGSSSRAQVYLQVAVRGWYATMAASSIVTSALLFIIWRHLGTGGIDTSDLAALLVSVVAGVATLVTQGEFEGIAGRLLGLPRILAGIEALLLLGAAALFLFTAPAGEHGSRPGGVAGLIFAMFVIAVAITVVINLSWVLAYLRQQKDKVTSPWEMGPGFDPSPELPADFWDGANRFGYTRPAIRVDSAEAWHHQFRWDPEIDQHVQILGERHAPAPASPPGRLDRFPGASWLRDRLPDVHNGDHGRGRSGVRGPDRD
jgi:NADH:ubiquinone oxidoreductase subunit K